MLEGVILNYLTRHATPTRFLNLNPPELALAGDATVLAALIETAPEWIVIVNRDVAEFSVLPFGGSPEYGGMLNEYVTATCERGWQSSGTTPSERLFPTCQVWQRRVLSPAAVTLP